MQPSSFTLFARKIKDRGWTKRMIRRKFLKNVDKDDYNKRDLKQILNWLKTI